MHQLIESSQQDQRFIVPDLCSAQAVFLVVIVTELMALCMVLFADQGRAIDWATLGRTSLFMQWVALSSAALLCMSRRWLAQRPLLIGASMAYALILSICLLYSIVAQWLVSVSDSSQWFRSELVLRNLLVCAVLGGIALRYFYVHSELQRRQKAELQARIEALHARIRPHFLFNTMNSIASLISEDPLAAEQAIEDLSELFRASLNEVEKQVSVRNEIALCRRYLAIESLRLGERLRVNWEIDTLPEDAKMPSLSLQPLVENAIYHGIQPRPGGGELCIRIRRRNGKIEARVSNPFDPRAKPVEAGNQIALENIRERLYVLYGNAAGLRLEQGDGKFAAILFFPV